MMSWLIEWNVERAVCLVESALIPRVEQGQGEIVRRADGLAAEVDESGDVMKRWRGPWKKQVGTRMLLEMSCATKCSTKNAVEEETNVAGRWDG